MENVIFEFKDGKKIARTIECNVKGKEETIELTENDLVFVTNGSCTESTIYGDHTHAPVGDAEVRTSGCWSLWKNIAKQDPSFGHPEKFCGNVSKSNWELRALQLMERCMKLSLNFQEENRKTKNRDWTAQENKQSI